MSSVVGTFHSINSSLPAENSATAQVGSTTAKSTAAAGIGTKSPDTLFVSFIGLLLQRLQQLQTTNPTEFKAEAAQTAAQLQKEAHQATDPSQARSILSLADKFKQASKTGNLSAFENDPNGTSGPYSHPYGSDPSIQI